MLGSTPETLTRLEAELVRRYPAAIIVGSYSPPFAPVDEQYIQDCAAKAAKGDSDVVWVGLGTPKQDILGTALAARLGK
ncbi:WecB/TagA/CpsF family glycosyltransferase, partial [Streptomyces sp. GbtcB7]|uniref:WecB/TagA/CpsF family glycosyltransferase n=1 Tax=Streptomyces sp. GbtcB7 TaxID=2824752 RepID=UPI0034D457CA